MAFDQPSRQPETPQSQLSERAALLGEEVDEAITSVINASQHPEQLASAVANALKIMADHNLITPEEANKLAQADTKTFLNLAREFSRSAYLEKNEQRIEGARGLQTVAAAKLSKEYRSAA